ncbi:transcription antitermination factor NusB [Brevibacillus sp. SYP-B805]|uniref:transcription antitermination factor NusB n=1 Tax=Brevibacillus sp. SYP-B805 TaxID=1578199 RepID=UPI0013EA9D56|nr:transcription antitermination factor NusB [Brevibacillus sp. SYP-B805]NGQ94707.1 transcription antitermination factor NusB [Brevibacillus sp. SYP-B805]
MKRRTAREKAVQCLFQIDMADVQLDDAIAMVLEENDETDTEYMRYLVKNTLQHLPEIDAEIKKYLRGWQLERIANVDRAILRLAFFELMHVAEIPEKVVLNEAIELAKLFSDEQSYRFVNGVLSSYLQNRQTTQA